MDHVSFGTCAERFGDDSTDVPPPGAYELDSEVSTGGEAGAGEGSALGSSLQLKFDHLTTCLPGCYSFKATAPRGLPMPKVASQGLDPGAMQPSRLLVFRSVALSRPAFGSTCTGMYNTAGTLLRKSFNTKACS